MQLANLAIGFQSYCALALYPIVIEYNSYSLVPVINSWHKILKYQKAR